MKNKILYLLIFFITCLVALFSFINFQIISNFQKEPSSFNEIKEEKLLSQINEMEIELKYLKEQLSVEKEAKRHQHEDPVPRDDELKKIEKQQRRKAEEAELLYQQNKLLDYSKQIEKKELEIELRKWDQLPTEYRNQAKEINEQPRDCIHTIFRDYKINPVKHSGRSSVDLSDCPIPCVSGVDDISSNLVCPHTKFWSATMENRGSSIGDMKNIYGNSRLHSDVVMQYFSWAEYDFMMPPRPKTSTAMLAVFISNCGPQFRLNYLKQLMENGVTVHSYGSCMNNINEEQRGNNHRNKVEIGGKYKFTYAFENSETEDYVTEKMFQPLVSGSVPIYHGAPNGKKICSI
jgi:hypothetical protein